MSDFIDENSPMVKKADKPRPKEKPAEKSDSDDAPKEHHKIPKKGTGTTVTNCNVGADVNPWTLIETFQILEKKESEKKMQQMSEVRKRKMAKALNDQIKLKNEATKLERDEDDKRLQRQQDEILKKWEEEQKLLMARENEKIEQLKKVRQDQIKDNLERRRRELAETRSEDLKEIQQITKDLLQEENEKLQKKNMEREKWEKIKAENAKKIELRELQKKEEEKLDAKLMEEFTTKMDLEEAKRVKALEDRARKLEINRQSLKQEPDQLLSDGMTSVERSMNKKIIEDAQAFLQSRSVRIG